MILVSWLFVSLLEIGFHMKGLELFQEVQTPFIIICYQKIDSKRGRVNINPK